MICSKCGKEKDVSEFPKSGNGKGIRSYCKKCHHLAIKIANDKVRKLKREYVEKDKQRGCQICGENRHYCLDYHHLDSSRKEKEVSRLLVEGSGLEKLIKEIEKCILVCANCHREIHYKENMGL